MDINIINRSLIRLGEPPISSTNQEPLGETLKTTYDYCRRLLISGYPWRFAIKRMILSPLDEESGHPLFKYKFQMPSDCLLFRDISEFNKFPDTRDYKYTNGKRYDIEGMNIYSNTKVLSVKYIADIDNPSMFSTHFSEALSLKIASDLAVKVHQNLNIATTLQQEFTIALQQAYMLNEIIADTEELPENSWVAIRQGWNNEY